MDSNDFMRFMAAWALVHETADEGWKAAVARGQGATDADASGGAGDFVDALSAAIAAEKERLKSQLASGSDRADDERDISASLDALRFEVAELRGRMESLQASVDALGERSGD